MGKLIMGVGISGSGKSTYLSQVAKKHDAVYVSSDEVRERLFGDASLQKDHARVFNEMKSTTARALSLGKVVYYDATNLNAKRRAALLKELKPDLAECLLFMTPVTLCRDRDRVRERTVGEEVIIKQLKGFQVPHLNEGWDKVRIIESPSWERGERDVYHLMGRCEGYDQGSHHHLLPLDAHLARTERKMVNLGYLPGIALYHDVGKPLCREMKKDLYATYYGHEGVSAYFSYWAPVPRLDELTPGAYRYLRTLVISLHMRHYSLTEAQYSKFTEKFTELERDTLLALNFADYSAH